MNNTKPVKILFDTDIGGDCDDAGTLAMLHGLCDRGEAELLAVTHCISTPYVAGCIDAINTFHGRQVPVGVNTTAPADDRGVYAAALCETFPNRYPADTYGTEYGAEDTLALLRRILREAEDGSITLVVTGNLNSMARLVTSGPDEISPMTGKDLIRQKLARTVVMGGRFYESWPMIIYADNVAGAKEVDWEWNIHGNIRNAQIVCREWPGELVFSSYEIGSYIKTMVGYPAKAPAGDPVALAYEIHNHGAGRCSWDQTAMLEAVRPGRYWNYHEFGRVTVDDAGITHWSREENGRQSYLLPKTDYEEIRQIIDELVLPEA